MSNTRKPTSKSIGKASVPMIGAGEFKAVCLDLMDKVKERHAEYIVTKRGRPYARLVPFDLAILDETATMTFRDLKDAQAFLSA